MKNLKKILNSAVRAQRKDSARRACLAGSVLQIIALIVLVVSFVGLFSSDAILACNVAGGLSVASMAFIGNISDVSDKQTFGKNLAYKVYLIDVTQIDSTKTFPQPNENREVGSIPMLNGEYFHSFEAHTIPTFSSKTEKGDITTSGTNTFTIVMGGIRDALLNFVEEFSGSKFVIVFKEMESSDWNILGSRERPLTLKTTESKNDSDGRYVTFTFERDSVNQYYHYVGDIITAAPVVNAADADTLAVKASAGTYQIPAGTAATYVISKVSGLTANDKGRFITLLGTAAANAPTIADNLTFVLIDGATWTAKSGSSITFRVLDSMTLIEVSNTRVQIV